MRAALALLLLVLALPAAADYPFDRVFTTPEQRRDLDAFRRDGEVPSAQQPEVPADSDEVPANEKVRFSGYLLRSDGRQTVWVDGQSDIGGDGSGNAGASHGRVRRGDEAVTFRARREARNLKPGQVWLLNEDRVVEGYQVLPQAPLPEESADADGES